MLKNYHELTSVQKTALKPLVAELRKKLYPVSALPIGQDDGLVINFGKGVEQRRTVTIKVI